MMTISGGNEKSCDSFATCNVLQRPLWRWQCLKPAAVIQGILWKVKSIETSNRCFNSLFPLSLATGCLIWRIPHLIEMPGICLITPLDILTFRPPLGALRATSTCQQCLISSYSPHAEPLSPCLATQDHISFSFQDACLTAAAAYNQCGYFTPAVWHSQHSFSTVSAQFSSSMSPSCFCWPASATAFAQSRPKLPVVSPQEISQDKKLSHISVEHLHSSQKNHGKIWKIERFYIFEKLFVQCSKLVFDAQNVPNIFRFSSAASRTLRSDSNSRRSNSSS